MATEASDALMGGEGSSYTGWGSDYDALGAYIQW